MVPNTFAYLVLGAWPFIAFALFRALPPGRAVLANIFIAYLFLPPPPTKFDLPLTPPLTKDTLPLIVALFAAMYFYKDKFVIWPRNKLVTTVMAIFVFSPAVTSLMNTDPIFFGRIGVPGLGIKDAVALVMLQFIMVIPMILAYNFLQQESDQRDILLAFCLFGLIYSLPMLIEVRLSPQLNIWIYGFFQHSFEQMMRYGGFRPIVFLYHGLWVAFFAMLAVCSAAVLSRSEIGLNRGLALISTLYLFAVLVLCKSAGSLLYALLLLPLILILPRALKLRIALAIVAFALTYPILKGAGILPEEELLQAIGRLSEDRAHSLRFRLDNENTLLARAMERPFFGWGSWGRNQILDPVTGVITTVTDGRWVISIGQFGWVGFLSEMLLLSLPIVLFWTKTRRNEQMIWSPYIGGICLMLAINILDLLPNATLTPLTWLMTGALLGYVENAKGLAREPKMRLRSVM